MGLAAVGAVFTGGLVFATIVAAAAIAALREWHRLINGGRIAREMIPTSLAMVAAVLLIHQMNGLPLALAAIALGALGAAVSAAIRSITVLWPIPWHAFGALYLGLPVISLALLRDDPRGSAIVGGLFVAVWTADTAALLAGLKSGKLLAVGLDVLPKEPGGLEDPLVAAWHANEPWLRGRVILGPHAAFFSPDAFVDLRSKCAETVINYLRDGKLANCVNTEYLKHKR